MAESKQKAAEMEAEKAKGLAAAKGVLPALSITAPAVAFKGMRSRPRRPSTPIGLKTLSLSAALDEDESSTVPLTVQSCLPRYTDEGNLSKEKWIPGSASLTMYGATGQRGRRSLAEYEADQKAFRRRRKKKKRRRRRLLIAMKESQSQEG